jgi:hypothetical protein
MSKLTKLILQPRRFMYDSRPYRRLLLAALTVRRVALSDATPVTDLGVSAEALRIALLDELAQCVPVLDVTDGGDTTIAVLREDTTSLSRWLHRLREKKLDVVLGARVSRLGKGSMFETMQLREASVFAVDDFIRLVRRFSVTFHDRVRDRRTSIDVQVWEREPTELVGPTTNRIARRIDLPTATKHGFFVRGRLTSVKDLLTFPLPTHVEDDIDVVFTWVNHQDPKWRALWKETVGSEPEQEAGDTRGLDRFMNRDELRFSLRSVARFAPWVRRVFIVSNCSPPPWLDTDNPRIQWVDHEEVLPREGLPVFNSHAIESRLQHVPGLAERFLYFNDDFFLMRKIERSHFFSSNGMSLSFVEGHGSVNGEPHPESPDYLNAARNGRRLIEEAFGRSATALHKHTPYALLRDVLLEMEERFHEPISRTSMSRFRSIDDISTVSFLYHHYAYLTGKATYAGSDATLIKPQTVHYPLRLHQLLEGAQRPVSLCLNDGGGGSGPMWDRYVVEFLNAFFPTPSEFER